VTTSDDVVLSINIFHRFIFQGSKICGNGGREDKIRRILCYVSSDEEPSLLELHGSWYITSLHEQSSLTPF